MSDSPEPIETITITRMPHAEGARVSMVRFKGVSKLGSVVLVKDAAQRAWTVLVSIFERPPQ